MKFIKWFLFVLMIILSTETMLAQKNHFLYIQTDNKQPFYAKLDKKIYSSSTAGYVIIPKLTNGDYTFSFGFPKNEWPEQKVTFTVKDSDAGYLFKNFGDKGWGFYNLQTSSITMAGNDQIDVVKKKEEAIIVNEEATPISKPSDIETPKLEKQEVVIKEQPKTEALKETIERTTYIVGNTGTEMVYKISNGDKNETVTIFIPTDKEVETPKELPNETPKKEDKKFIDIIEPVNNDKSKELISEVVKPVTVTQEKTETPVVKEENKSTLKIPNSNCKTYATEDDYIKLRKKIVNANSENEMLFRANEGFKKACYTTEQIQTLSYLFLSNESKYKFFDTAYPFVFDSEKFVVLEAMFTDAYWKNRFKAMLH